MNKSTIALTQSICDATRKYVSTLIGRSKPETLPEYCDFVLNQARKIEHERDGALEVCRAFASLTDEQVPAWMQPMLVEARKHARTEGEAAHHRARNQKGIVELDVNKVADALQKYLNLNERPMIEYVYVQPDPRYSDSEKFVVGALGEMTVGLTIKDT